MFECSWIFTSIKNKLFCFIVKLHYTKLSYIKFYFIKASTCILRLKEKNKILRNKVQNASLNFHYSCTEQCEREIEKYFDKEERISNFFLVRGTL